METQTVFTANDNPKKVADCVTRLFGLLKPWQQIVISVRSGEGREAEVSSTVINPQAELRALVDEYVTATTNELRAELGQKISSSLRLQRKAAGLSLERVATALRISTTTVYRAERRNLPKSAVLFAYIDFIERCLPLGK